MPGLHFVHVVKFCANFVHVLQDARLPSKKKNLGLPHRITGFIGNVRLRGNVLFCGCFVPQLQNKTYRQLQILYSCLQNNVLFVLQLQCVVECVAVCCSVLQYVL